jgi:hypothetical protein
MAHYAKIGVGNIVTKVHVLSNEVLMKDGVENAQQGIEFLQNLYNNKDLYIQTSYNGTFRKNYAGEGHTYDQTRDAFIAPKPYPSWTLNDDTCRWNAPSSYPDDGKKYDWDEENLVWKEI